jgi:hypothetical protein
VVPQGPPVAVHPVLPPLVGVEHHPGHPREPREEATMRTKKAANQGTSPQPLVPLCS